MNLTQRILDMDFPYNVFYYIGIKNPTQDQIDGLFYVFSNDKGQFRILQDMFYLKFKHKLSDENIFKYISFSSKTFFKRYRAKLLYILQNDGYIKFGLEGNKKRIELERIEKEKEYKRILTIVYKKVMSLNRDKSVEDKSAKEIKMYMSAEERKYMSVKKIEIDMIENYLFKKDSISRDKKYISIDFLSNKILNYLYCHMEYMQDDFIDFKEELKDFYISKKLSLYHLLYMIYDYPIQFGEMIKGFGAISEIELLSALYNKNYISEEQLLFIYLYSKQGLKNVKSFEEVKNYVRK